MATHNVDFILADYGEEHLTVKLLWSIFGVLPGAPAMSVYRSVDECAMLTAPGIDATALVKAKLYVNSDEARAVMDAADLLDKGDVGISVYTGLRSALSLFFGDRKKALDTDPQQGADAALKALGIAWSVHKLFPGSVPEKVAALRALPSGEALLYYFAAVEVALPFTDDVATGVGSAMGNLVQKYGGGLAGKLEALGGAGAFASAQAMLTNLTGPLDGIAKSAADNAEKIAGTAKAYLPGAIATAGTVAGAVATAADALPIYRFLMARVVAEAAIQRAVAEGAA